MGRSVRISNRKQSNTLGLTVIYSLLSIGLIFMIFPYVWMVLASFIGMIGIFYMRYDLVHDAQLYPMNTMMTHVYQVPEKFVEYFPSSTEMMIGFGAIGICLILYFVGTKLFDLDEAEGAGQGQGVAAGGLFDRGSDDDHLSQRGERLAQSVQSVRFETVVVSNQNFFSFFMHILPGSNFWRLYNFWG